MSEQPKVGHPQCYARELGGCAGPLTKEHPISASILQLIEDGEPNKYVQVFGLSFQAADSIKKVGIASLSAGMLCEKHHAPLSDYDAAGRAMFSAVQSLDAVAGDSAAPSQTLRVDGDGLERWMLKAMIGGIYSGNFPVAPGTTMRGVLPPVELLEILFMGFPFPLGQGLYWLPPAPGEIIASTPQILRLSPLVAQISGDVGGVRVWYFGLPFCLLTARPADGDTLFANAVYRPAGLRTVGSNVTLVFDWRDGPQSREIELKHVAIK